MKIALLTNEYPPNIYGGAGVHVEYLSRELAHLDGNGHEIRVLTFGTQRETKGNLVVQGIGGMNGFPAGSANHPKMLDTLFRDMMMADVLGDADIIHCHTWYTHLAGCLLKNLLRSPLVLTTHSLEPHRPWKREQLGPAYHVSSWLEKTAYQNADGIIAVSEAMMRDVHELYGVPLEKIRVIHNGIDPDQYKPVDGRETLGAYSIKPDKPFVLFVGRITRQKGIIHLVNAIKYLKHNVQVVLCAGSPDTERIAREMQESVHRARTQTNNEIIWIPEFLPKEAVIRLYSHAALFVCPSVYEPFGIINLEAMACGVPVVASDVGGIREVVVHEDTGLLVPLESKLDNTGEPRNPEKFSRNLASAMDTLLSSPERREGMCIRARKRVEDLFSWRSIARGTLEFYENLRATGKVSPG